MIYPLPLSLRLAFNQSIYYNKSNPLISVLEQVAYGKKNSRNQIKIQQFPAS